MKKLLPILILVGASVALAAGGEHGGEEHGIPKVVYYQAINVVLLFAGLVYFTKDFIVKFFADRKAAYVAAAEKSKSAREEAEKQFVDIKHKLEQLTMTTGESVSRARAEAADMRNQMIRDAQEMAARIQREAETTAKIEVQKAQVQLRDQLLREAVQTAKSVLSKDIGSADQQKLQSEFIKNVEAVNP